MAEIKLEFEAVINKFLLDQVGTLATALHEISLMNGDALFIDNPDREWHNDADREWALRTALEKIHEVALTALGNLAK